MNREGVLTLLKGALVLILPLLAIATFLTWTFYFSRTQASTSLLLSNEERVVDQQLNNITADIRMVTTDLKFLSSNMHLKLLVPNKPIENSSHLAMVKQEFLQFSRAKRFYDQIRFLDDSGMETVRINFNSGHPSIVPDELLQNKKGRYYFDEAFSLNKGEIFISPLDFTAVSQFQISDNCLSYKGFFGFGGANSSKKSRRSNRFNCNNRNICCMECPSFDWYFKKPSTR